MSRTPTKIRTGEVERRLAHLPQPFLPPVIRRGVGVRVSFLLLLMVIASNNARAQPCDDRWLAGDGAPGLLDR